MSKKKATAVSLPISRTGKIMTSAVGVESVSQDIVALATKATEMFLIDFARQAHDPSSNVLEYKDLERIVHEDDQERYSFLADTIPRKIKFSEALRLHQEANEREARRIEEERQREEEARMEEESRQEEEAADSINQSKGDTTTNEN